MVGTTRGMEGHHRASAAVRGYATAHAESSGHALIQSFEPREDWFHDYETGDGDRQPLVMPTGPDDAGPMTSPDQDVLTRINSLVEEEHQLRSSGEPDADRLRQLEEQLDQCWDLLRQRRAKREYHQDTAEAEPRPVDTVEHYRQ
jgi:hypothetical protein